MITLLQNTLSHIDEKGICDIDEKFLEWSNCNTLDEEAAFYAMLIVGLTAGTELLEILDGFGALAEQCKKSIDRIRTRKIELHGNKQAAMVGLSGSTSFLSRHILVIKLIEPGYRKIKIKPHLGELPYAEGIIPTPYGAITVRHEMTEGGIKTNVSVPEGVEIRRRKEK